MTVLQRPFRADHVGSLLRPERLKEARTQFQNNEISAADLQKVEDEEIVRIIEKQLEVGLHSITDGEFRRSWWHFDFLENLDGVQGYTPEHGLSFEGVETRSHNVRITDKVSFNPNHPHFEHFKFLYDKVGDRGIAKVSIPSPNQLFHPNILNEDLYPDIKDFAHDVAQAYHESLQKFYDLGARYIQLDDVYWANLTSGTQKTRGRDRSEEEKERARQLAYAVINEAIQGLPEDLLITTHICRGNYKSTWAISGGYEPIAPYLFKEKLGGFFLEYDDDRSGDFEPLRYFPENRAAVLGLFTSKSGELENKETILARIEEAKNYISEDQICLSPQCGFASTEEGNKLTEEEQWKKLAYVVEIANDVFNTSK
ncbi:5-methyltetrahydropteroyltriglutamate--homocysteine S-methyltransferase [Staphylococcus kloosii]|jgi:5-methyltetrahydropteroyltriglutamate--homocysteine methyltransferase|uniref:5-methyltetrahydropteroyltriglutamate--homocysteine methyltransferase n=1 Tax=Staphylococcus kloosii TaxID=29384 RepID=A0ABQ0XNJ6_9STAP|nr:5-methyltetrahydropteroyltriglutamate--homocysteine S-methyltransferase [Staphylococcus kloosii]AVQ36874.1 5-methyltetrahydropteroyltriglutamate--homocysteine S-methyltransferase [Staphylococcus kloosii]PNZ06984.1 5-methyltetrahydropteroyltriglutamate--homocysteine methyltransferase [Staphylococcus kloosii]GEP83002.1 5-methyltetrahydropteroyltriglutamate--homocysteine methyltransferase [Staphylococcus kloosii]SUM49974.1 methionine synthase II [Staphylococcus kloosii]